jgi:uncharacterized protein
MSLYLDASVLVPAVVVEQASPAVVEFLLGRADDLIVGDFAAAEVASALSTAGPNGSADDHGSPGAVGRFRRLAHR